MSKRVPTGVSPLGIFLALAMVSLIPAPATANSINPITFADAISPDGTTQTFGGTFTVDNDVALWKFFLGAGAFEFSATTTSAALGFDPLMSLYYSAVDGDASLYHHVLYDDPFIGPTPAIFDDRAEGDLDSSFSLTLATRGFYILALTEAGNDHQDGPPVTDLPGMTFGWDDNDSFQCQPGLICGNPDIAFGHFSVETRLTPADSTPVPEPGTLSLIALGSLATACLRRRRRTVVTTRQ